MIYLLMFLLAMCSEYFVLYLTAYYFEYNAALCLSAVFSHFCIMPWGRHCMYTPRERRYRWADEINITNPLYVGGHFRKSASEKNVFSKVKGCFYCEMLICGIWIFVILCEGCFIGNVRPIILDWIYAFLFIVADAGWFGFRIYYKWYYCERFRYTENREHIWKPFSNISQHKQWGDDGYETQYYMQYEKIQLRLKKECPKHKYILGGTYSQDMVQSDIYWRKTKNGADIFQIACFPQYAEQNMELLNEFFADMWKRNIKEENCKAKITFLLCIEEHNSLLRRRILENPYVDQKAGKYGRYRLPVILTYSENYLLNILPLYSKHRGKKEYDEMKKELYEILDLSGKYAKEAEEVYWR